MIAPLNVNKAISTLPTLASGLFSHLMDDDSNNEKASDASQKSDFDVAFASADPIARVELVKAVVRNKLGSLLGVEGEDIEPTRKISEIGVDSLMAVEVKAKSIFVCFISANGIYVNRTG